MRRAAELELDTESKRQAGRETVHSYTVDKQDRITPFRKPAAAAAERERPLRRNRS